MNIFLLRHGETDWNKVQRLQGHTDIPLNQNGRSQIKQVADTFANMNADINLIISSPLSRAYESAEIVADSLGYVKEKILVEPLLIERCFGAGEGLTVAERKEKYPGDNYPGMESYEQLIERANAAFQKVVSAYSDKENILLVAHGAILYAILTAITDGKMAYGGPLTKFEPGSIHRVTYLDGAMKIAKYSTEEKIKIIWLGQ